MEMEPRPPPHSPHHLPPGPNLEGPELNTEGQQWMTLSPGLPGREPSDGAWLVGAERRPGRNPAAGRRGKKHSDKATAVTSSVWDTRPWAKGSSSAVAGATRMLWPRHTEVSDNTCVLTQQKP